MDFQEKIQLNETRNVDSINVDTAIKLNLQANSNLTTEYDLQNVLNVAEIFDEERQASTIYRIYGSFNYFSLTNGMKRNYDEIRDIFVAAQSGQIKNPYTDLNIYLVKPASSGYISLGNNQYERKFEIVTQVNIANKQSGVRTPKRLNRAGFHKDIFGETQYSLICDVDFDIKDQVDFFGFPLTELFLYVEYLPETSKEEMFIRTFVDSTTNNKVFFNPTQLNEGDIISGDKILYNEEEFLQTKIQDAEHYIEYTFNVDGGDKGIVQEQVAWKYNPFIPIRLRYFESEVRQLNTGTTSYDDSISIPNYAKAVDNEGNVVWRNILDNGFIDPIENIGVAFPFLNQKHYVFNNFFFAIKPNLNASSIDFNPFTIELFDEIEFENNRVNSVTPEGELNNIGKGCE